MSGIGEEGRERAQNVADETHSGSGAANFAVPYKTVLPSDMLECRPQPEDKARETAL
jgi:hypothetical protein